MQRTQRSHAWVVAGLAVLATGCVASIQEERLYGAPRPRFEGPPDVVGERRAGTPAVVAAARGSILDISVRATSECRSVDVTTRVRDVALRRSFTNDAQERNGALAMLVGAGATLLQYSAEQIDCPSGGACWSTMISAEYAMLALAAVPVGFIVANALRVRDGRTTEAASPEIREGAWQTCSTEPLAGEPVAISIGGVELVRITDSTGHASVDLASLSAQLGSTSDPRALVRHRGSSDVTVDLATPQAPAPTPLAPDP